MTNVLSISDLNLKNQRVLLRVDFNVPVDEKGQILDDTRIKAALETIQYILEKGGIPVLMSHFGRPCGKVVPKYSLKPCAERLSELLKLPVKMATDCCGETVKTAVQQLNPGEIILLENLRFHPGEENPASEAGFANALAELGDVYVDDAFGCAHRNHASITEVPKFFCGKAAAGFLMEKEIEYLGSTLLNPKRPFYVLLGGAKISTKFDIIKRFMENADEILIGGAMAFNFFKSENISVGDSLVENAYLTVARELIDVSTQSRCRLILPLDFVVAKEISPSSERRIVSIKDGIPDGFKGVDIGPETIKYYKEELKKAVTIFWNGPMGVFETPPFDVGTNSIAQALATLPAATTIVGGGDSVAAVNQLGLQGRMSHLSTGGGAALEYIEFGTLPGIEALHSCLQKQLV